MYFQMFVGALCLAWFWYALLCVLSSFAIIMKRKRELVPFVGLQYAIVVFPDHTYSLITFLNVKIQIRTLYSFISDNS